MLVICAWAYVGFFHHASRKCLCFVGVTILSETTAPTTRIFLNFVQVGAWRVLCSRVSLHLQMTQLVFGASAPWLTFMSLFQFDISHSTVRLHELAVPQISAAPDVHCSVHFLGSLCPLFVFLIVVQVPIICFAFLMANWLGSYSAWRLVNRSNYTRLTAFLSGSQEQGKFEHARYIRSSVAFAIFACKCSSSCHLTSFCRHVVRTRDRQVLQLRVRWRKHVPR